MLVISIITKQCFASIKEAHRIARCKEPIQSQKNSFNLLSSIRRTLWSASLLGFLYLL